MKNFNHIITKRIESLKNEQNLSWEKLAYSAGLSKSGVCQIKNEKNLPTLSSLIKICLALGISPKEFFDFDLKLDDID